MMLHQMTATVYTTTTIPVDDKYQRISAVVYTDYHTLVKQVW